ncbi:ATP--guanido phosphotransferase [Leptospira sp. 96542]|nr:ATP--guanido phosphotransferase [Leptospira sp. 96542]
MTEVIFLENGKFGCSHCPFFFWKRPKRNYPRLEIPDHTLTHLRNLSVLSYRIRYTRNLKTGYFPYYDAQENGVKQLLGESGFYLQLEPKQVDPNKIPVESERFYLGGEDHLRYERIFFKKRGFLEKKSESLRAIRKFFFRKSVFAYERGVGFISSCPTNLGLGLRVSVLVLVPEDQIAIIFPFLANLHVFGIEFAASSDHGRETPKENLGVIAKISCKNPTPVQKREFFKFLGLLGFP